MLEIFKTPIIIAAVIAGSITALGIIVQWFIASAKSSLDTKTMFEKNLKEKLENIYSPLIMKISMRSNRRNLVEDDVMTLINRYGYLLSSELSSSLKELCILEGENPEEDIEDSKEYQNLRVKVEELASREFAELQNSYNNSFNIYKVNSLKPWYEKIILLIEKSSLLFTGVFWFICIMFLFLLKIQPINLFQSEMGNRLISLVILIITITSVLFLSRVITKIYNIMEKFISKKRKLFMPIEYVPKTGIYRCKTCGELRDFYKYERFPYCNSKKIKHIIKSSIFDYIWSINN